VFATSNGASQDKDLSHPDLIVNYEFRQVLVVLKAAAMDLQRSFAVFFLMLQSSGDGTVSE